MEEEEVVALATGYCVFWAVWDPFFGPLTQPEPLPPRKFHLSRRLTSLYSSWISSFSLSASLIVYYHRSIQKFVNTLFSCLWIRLLAPSLGAAFGGAQADSLLILSLIIDCTWIIGFHLSNIVTYTCTIYTTTHPHKRTACEPEALDWRDVLAEANHPLCTKIKFRLPNLHIFHSHVT